jgi:hypothetical protein
VTNLQQSHFGVLYRHELAIRRLEQFFEEGAGVDVVVYEKDAWHG